MEQPKIEIQEMLDGLLAQEPEVIAVCGRKYRIGWMHHANERKITRIMLKEKNPWKRNVKVAACVLLNRRWGIWTWLLLTVWYAVYWRWLYYVRDIDQVEVAAVISAGKKKGQSEVLMMGTLLATGMMDTLMTIARHEAGPAGLGGAVPTP